MNIHACVGNKEVVEHELHQHDPQLPLVGDDA